MVVLEYKAEEMNDFYDGMWNKNWILVSVSFLFLNPRMTKTDFICVKPGSKDVLLFNIVAYHLPPPTPGCLLRPSGRLIGRFRWRLILIATATSRFSFFLNSFCLVKSQLNDSTLLLLTKISTFWMN